MTRSLSNQAIIAGAGSRKTQHVVDQALSVDSSEPTLITTYTISNQREIISRIENAVGVVPQNITVMGWFSFLMSQGARPYQSSLTGSVGVIRGLNFHGRRSRYAKQTDLDHYFFDSSKDMYRDGVSDFVRRADEASGGAVVDRLERLYRHIFIDECQDLVGYDLDVLDLLFDSRVAITAVGDPRQHTLATNRGTRNKQYRGSGILNWFTERDAVCKLKRLNKNYRSNQAICDFADAIYPELPTSTSASTTSTDHDGIFEISESEAAGYFREHEPIVLRHNILKDTLGLPAINIGVSKGMTYDRVLIFPTQPMLRFLADRDPNTLGSRDSLYVAATRARHSVAFVVPSQG